MSTYGLQTYDANGNPLITVDEKMTRVRYTTVAASGVSGSVTLDDLTDITTAEISIPLNVLYINQVAHEVSRSGNVITWTAAGSGVDSLIIVFIYV